MADDASHPTESRFADSIAVLTALDRIASQHPELPELTLLTLAPDGLMGTPWLFCKPITSLLMWVKQMPGRVAVRPTQSTGIGTQLTAIAHLDGYPVLLTVTTHRTDIPTGASGLINRTALAQLASAETGAPDLAQALDMETIRAPHAPMPAMAPFAPETPATVSSSPADRK